MNVVLNKDDLVTFLNATIASTGQKEAYNKKEDQQQALADLHTRVMHANRDFYGLMLLAGINEFNREIIVTNLLKSGRAIAHDIEYGNYEKHLVLHGLHSMGAKYGVRALIMLAKNGVCNGRSAWVASQYLQELMKNDKLTVINRRKIKKIDGGRSGTFCE